MVWARLLTRVRNRRDRLETPSPAHDLLIAGIEKLSVDRALIELTGEEPSLEEILRYLFSSSLALAGYAEALASETGLLRDRQFAAEALTCALAVARRATEEGASAEGIVA